MNKRPFDSARGPLSDVRVLDLSAVVSGPLTCGLLGDLGAEVIKIERCHVGDVQRGVGSQRNGMSGMFHVLNRGKRSLCLDLSRPESKAILYDLVPHCDVVVQNFRPGVADRLGIGYEDLVPINDQLIYVSISGFGPDGPRAGDRAYDPVIQVYSGIAAVQGRPRAEGPEQVNQLLLDKLTAYTASGAVNAALYARERTRMGQHITLSMLDTAIAFLWTDAAADRILLDQDDKLLERPPVGAAGRVTQFADGYGVTFALHDVEFRGLCKAYGLPEIADDPDFADLPSRIANREKTEHIFATQIAPIAASLTLAQAEQRFNEQDVPFAYARELDELIDDPQVRHNRSLQERLHPVAGRIREAVPAPRFGLTPATPGRPAPLAGEHSQEILAELGYTANEIQKWLRDGVVSEP